MFDLNRFLMDRELRAEKQFQLIEKLKLPLISLRTNYPGENKNEFIPLQIVDEIAHELLSILGKNIVNEEIIESLEGKSYLFSVDMDAISLKKLTMEIEETHILGRYVDIDVFDENSNPLSRQQFGHSKRKCFICDEMAFVCGRNFTHTHEEIKKHIENKYKLFLKQEKQGIKCADSLSDLALKSMILEVSSNPSFGLVSPLTKGSHTDMDFFTFVESSFAIKPFFKEMALAGYSPLSLDIIFNKIRKIGILAERDMFLSTQGVNTHKGMIFLMGISVACVAKVLYDKKDFEEISSNISYMCRDILQDFNNLHHKSSLTHGEKLFINHGITGIRGEAKEGLKTIFNGSIEVFETALSTTCDINRAMIKTLLFLMSSLEDSTILHRHDFNTLREVQKIAKTLLENDTLHSEPVSQLLLELEKDFISKRISPGGAADALAVTIFLSQCKNKLF